MAYVLMRTGFYSLSFFLRLCLILYPTMSWYGFFSWTDMPPNSTKIPPVRLPWVSPRRWFLSWTDVPPNST